MLANLSARSSADCSLYWATPVASLALLQELVHLPLLYEPHAVSQGDMAKRRQQKSKLVGRADVVKILLMTEFY